MWGRAVVEDRAGCPSGRKALTSAPPVLPMGYLPDHDPGAATRVRNTCPATSCALWVRTAKRSMARWVRTWRPAIG